MIIELDTETYRMKRILLRIEKEITESYKENSRMPIFQYSANTMKRKKIYRVKFKSPKFEIQLDVPLKNRELCGFIEKLNRLVVRGF